MKFWKKDRNNPNQSWKNLFVSYKRHENCPNTYYSNNSYQIQINYLLFLKACGGRLCLCSRDFSRQAKEELKEWIWYYLEIEGLERLSTRRTADFD
jgi:hypothetical protein